MKSSRTNAMIESVDPADSESIYTLANAMVKERVQGKTDGPHRKAFIEANMRVAAQVSNRFCQLTTLNDDDDIFQAAMVGLIKAADRYDPDRGIAFPVYAKSEITKEIYAEIGMMRGNVSLKPTAMSNIYFRTGRAKKELSKELNRTPSVSEISERSGVDITDVLIVTQFTNRYEMPHPDTY